MNLTLTAIPSGKELKRSPCPITDPYQGRYIISPRHSLLVISQEQKISVFEFATGEKLWSIPAPDHWHPKVSFLNEDCLLLNGNSATNETFVLNARTGKEIAVIPDSDDSNGVLAFSPDSRHLAIPREKYGLKAPRDRSGGAGTLPRPLVIVWSRVGD